MTQNGNGTGSLPDGSPSSESLEALRASFKAPPSPRARPLPASDSELRARRERFRQEAATLAQAAHTLACNNGGSLSPAQRREYDSLMSRARYRKTRVQAITIALGEKDHLIEEAADRVRKVLEGSAPLPDGYTIERLCATARLSDLMQPGPIRDEQLAREAAEALRALHTDAKHALHEWQVTSQNLTPPARSWWSRFLSWLTGGP